MTVGGTRIDDITVGLSTRFSKTVSESDVYLFARHVLEPFKSAVPSGASS